MAYVHLTEENFKEEVIKSSLPVLVDFYAEWCGPCKMLGPTIEQIATEFEGKWKVCKLNVDEVPGVAGEYGIQSIPTILFFKDGQVVDQMMGFRPKDDITGKMV